MISDKIKSRFISKILTEEAQWIGARQQEVIDAWGLRRTGMLYNSLRGFFSVKSAGGRGVLTLRYLAYMRFLDIQGRKKGKKHKYSGLHLYNRIVFGRIYGTTQRRLMYDFTDSVRQTIAAELQEAANSLNE